MKLSLAHSRAPTRLLVVSPATPEVLEAIRERFPEIRTEACDVDDVGTVIRTINPDATFVSTPGTLDAVCWSSIVSCNGLRWLHVGSVGFEKVPPWDPTSLTVTNSGGAGADEMAEYVIGAMLMANTGFVSSMDNQRQRKWHQNWWTPLRGKTLTVIGVGHIGSRVIEKARALGLRIVAVRERIQSVPGAEITFPSSRLHEALDQADFVSVQVPLNDCTRHLLDRKALSHMRPSAWLINVSRGPVVDQAALIEALEQERIGGVVLDVFQVEPLPAESKLWGLKNAVVTPHISGCITNWYQITTRIFCENLQRFQSGTPLENVVQYKSRSAPPGSLTEISTTGAWLT